MSKNMAPLIGRMIKAPRNVIEKQQRDLEIEEIKRLQQKAYQLDPLLWLQERFGENPLDLEWSKREGYLKKTKWDGDIDPLANAWRALAGKKWAALEAGTGTAKTYTASRIMLWFLDCFPNSLVVTSAPKQDQLKLHLWNEVASVFHKFKRIRPKAALYNLRLVVEEEDIAQRGDDAWEKAVTSKSWQAVGFVAGVAGDETSATKAQGFHRTDMLIITEETPGMPEPVMTAFKNTCTGNNNLILAVGNPDSQLDPLHRFATLPNVANFRVSAYDYPNVVEKKEIIPGAVTRESIYRRRADVGRDSDLYKSRVRGISPSQSSEALIRLDWCQKAVDKVLQYDGTWHAVGADVANSIDGDKAALAWGRGNILCEIQEFFCPNANHLAYNLFMDSQQLALNGYKDYNTSKLVEYEVMDGFVGVDAVGVGVATINTLSDNGYNPVSLHGGQWEEAIPEEDYTDKEGETKTRLKYRFQGLRSQMYWEAREDLRQGLIHMAIEDKEKLLKLFVELIAVKVSYKNNFIVVEPKENIKKRLGNKSPNMADAFVYWNWVRKGYRSGAGLLPVMG